MAQGKPKGINTTAFVDTRLSIKAKGVMAYLLSKPDGWRGQVFDIVNNSTSGKKTVQAALKELTIYGYVKLIKTRKPDGALTSYYLIFDKPAVK